MDWRRRLLVGVVLVACGCADDGGDRVPAGDEGEPDAAAEADAGEGDDVGPVDEVEGGASLPPDFPHREMVLAVLETMIRESARPDGNWIHTQTGDTIGLAPRTLIEYGALLDRPEYAALALTTADWYTVLVEAVVLKLLTGEPIDGLELGKAFGGAPSLIDAYVHTGDAEYRDTLATNLSLINGMIINDPSLIAPGGDFSIYGTLFTGGAIATVNAEFALGLRRVGTDDEELAATHVGRAADFLELLDQYRQPAGHYTTQADGPPTAGQNCNVLMALATQYLASGEAVYLERASDLLAAIEELWDEEQGAYVLQPGDTYIGLAENAVLIYARLLLHQATGEAAHLAAARRVFQFCEDVLFRTLPAEADPPGGQVLLHDNEGHVGEWYWCSGCNFLGLYGILLMERQGG